MPKLKFFVRGGKKGSTTLRDAPPSETKSDEGRDCKGADFKGGGGECSDGEGGYVGHCSVGGGHGGGGGSGGVGDHKSSGAGESESHDKGKVVVDDDVEEIVVDEDVEPIAQEFSYEDYEQREH